MGAADAGLCESGVLLWRVEILDARISATAIEHGLAVVTQDADFDLIADAGSSLDVIRCDLAPPRPRQVGSRP